MKVAVMRVKAAELNMLRVLERSSLAPNHLAKRSKETDQILLDFEWQTMLASLRDSSTELQAARTLIAEQERLFTEATARLWASKALAPKPAMPLPKVTAAPPMRPMPLPKVTAAPPIAAIPLRKVAAELLFQDEVRIRLVPVAQEGDAGPSAGAGQVLILPVISQGADRHVEK